MAVSKGDGPAGCSGAVHASRRAEPVIGPRFARTRWRAPQHDGSGGFQLQSTCQTAEGARLRVSAAGCARGLRQSRPLKLERAQGRPGTGWHPGPPRKNELRERVNHR